MSKAHRSKKVMLRVIETMQGPSSDIATEMVRYAWKMQYYMDLYESTVPVDNRVANVCMGRSGRSRSHKIVNEGIVGQMGPP